MARSTKHGQRYDAEFKREAISLVLEQGLSVNKVAQDLGISYESLNRWVKEARAVSHPTTALSLQDEVRRLRRELEVMTMERDILKKAVGIVSPRPK